MTTDITELVQSLKAAAEKATPGRWEYYPGNTSIEYNVDSMDEDQGSIVYVDSGDFTQAQTDRNGEFIALANPASILALVEALEKAQQRISELDIKNCELDSLTQRWAVERAENADRIAELESQLKSAENNDIDARCHIAELESRTVTPVNYSENTDADHCRKLAWQQVKGEVSTEGWTSGDNATYFGFFCWGWDMRRQYNEQRPINAKLPKTMYTEFDDDDYCREVAVLDKQQVIDCLTSAGIKVEAE